MSQPVKIAVAGALGRMGQAVIQTLDGRADAVLAKDGEAALRAGRLLLSENKYSQAKSLIQQGIDKGVKQQGVAYMLLAETERGLKN